ncbi:MAG: fructose-1,6-bisphosphatase [Thaumarchaeota archaeon]|nr:fructose-1,6-bisphosphatase [Nitrososphaerota archaeon]
MTILEDHLRANSPDDLALLISAIAATSVRVRDALPMSRGMTRGINPSGEKQAEIDVYANDLFATSLISTGRVKEVASEEMAEAMMGRGSVHVAMDPLDGSSNISTNNPLGSIFGLYSSKLPCSGKRMVGAAYVTYGPMLTLTYSTGGGVQTFVAVEREGRTEFTLLETGLRIPEDPEVFGFGGQRREWIEPVERFVASLEDRGMKLRYGGTFVGDYNQVLRYGGIFGYPELKSKPKGKLRVLYEAAPMAYITREAHGFASDGSRDILSLSPSSLAESTPVYMGTESLVREVESMISGR